MKNISILILSFSFYAAISPVSFAQYGNLTAGGDASGTGGSMSYSVGQVDYLLLQLRPGQPQLRIAASLANRRRTAPYARHLRFGDFSQ
jgi:hypothetical protein